MPSRYGIGGVHRAGGVEPARYSYQQHKLNPDERNEYLHRTLSHRQVADVGRHPAVARGGERALRDARPLLWWRPVEAGVDRLLVCCRKLLACVGPGYVLLLLVVER